MKTPVVSLLLPLLITLVLTPSCEKITVNPIDDATKVEVVFVAEHGAVTPRGAVKVAVDSVLSPDVVPLEGYVFKGWDVSENIEVIGAVTNPGSSLRIKGDGTATAVFERKRPVLTITAPEHGTISPAVGKYTVPFDTVITLTVTPDTGYQFKGWDGATGKDSTTISINEDKTVSAMFAEVPGQEGVVYVWQGAIGDGNGSNWANAYTNLKTAFLSPGANKQIWIAGGRYQSAGAATECFAPQSGAKIFGGFTGFESDTNRIWYNNLTVLSGNNAFNYVVDLYQRDNVTLNGLVIENGVRSGVYISPPSTTTPCNIIVANCIVRNNNVNRGYTSPRAIYCNGFQVIIRNCVFYNNRGTDNDGQALHIQLPGTKVENCIFYDNDGPAISSQVADADNPAKIINCTIYNNGTAPGHQLPYPGGIKAARGALVVRGSILYANGSSGNTGTQIDSAMEVQYCCIQDCDLEGIGIYKKTSGYQSETNFNVNPGFNSTSQPLDDRNWYIKNDQVVPFIPSNGTLKARFSNSRPGYDLRGVIRPTDYFDFGAYENTPTIRPSF